MEYASRLLIPAGRNYSTTEKEALAVVWAVEQFHGYIEGFKVLIRTNHQTLKWLLSLKSPSGHLARWALKLQPYDLEVGYTPGKINVIADTLSRPPIDNLTDDVEINEIRIQIPTRSSAEIRKAQTEDAEVKKIIDAFEINDESMIRWAQPLGCSKKCCTNKTQGDTEEPQQVVSAQERGSVLQQFHDAPTTGHYGIERMLRTIATWYWLAKICIRIY